MNKTVRIIAILAIIFMNVGCDQLSKSVVRDNLEYNESIHLINDNVMLIKVENTGAFLSLGDSLHPALKTVLLSILPTLGLLVALFWLFSQNLNKGMLIGLCCIVGGGIGNIFDRLAYGSVTDFLYIHFGIFRTGIFNFADVSITFGTLLIIVQQLFVKKA